MATRSPTTTHPYWGTFATTAALPNVAGSPTQKGTLEAGDQAYVTGSGLYLCTDSTLGAAAWIVAAPLLTPIIEAGTTRLLADSDHDRTIICTNAAGCVITVPDTVSPGLTVAVIQRGAAAVSVIGSGTMVASPAAPFLPQTAAVGSMATIYVESATVCNVIGDLAT
jgi:hypothetical protein